VCNGNAKKIFLVTGAAGFIGSNFVRYLYQKNDDIEVRVLDKLTYSGNKESLKDIIDQKGFTFVKGDICDSEVVAQLMDNVDVVINFAAEAAVDRSIEDSQPFLQTDIIGVHVLLEAARKQKNLPKFIQISTDEVYGQIIEGSFTEQSELRPRNPYSASKLGGDCLAYSYFATYNLPVIITRAANTYGPMAYPEKIIPLFITNLIDGLNIPVYGEGKQIRDWLHVTDHCSAIYHLLKYGIHGEVYNIAADQEYSNIDLTRKILELMGKDETSMSFVNDRPGHDFRYSLDCTKLRGIGWEPKFNFDEGLKGTVDWYRNNEQWWRPVKEKMDQRYLTGFWGGKK